MRKEKVPFYNKINKCKLSGEIYDFKFRKIKQAYGFCMPAPKRGKPNITINPTDCRDEKHFLQILIHEALHGCEPFMTEAKVTKAGRDIGKMLWRFGFRLNDSAALEEQSRNKEVERKYKRSKCTLALEIEKMLRKPTRTGKWGK